MTAPVAAPPTVEVPSKCAPTPGVGVPANPCRKPGSMLRCLLCPRWSGYWRNALEVTPR